MNAPVRVVYAGTPDFAVPALNMLAQRYPPMAVYTQPDRPAGRGQAMQESPVKRRARELGLQVRQPASLKSSMAVSALATLKPDVMVVAAYGLILPEEILTVPRIGCINIHASLLPRWRGAAPIQRAIMAGDSETGITIMQMDKGLDTGGILLKQTTPISEDDTAETLHDRLSMLGAEALMTALPAALDGQLSAVAQDETEACYAAKLTKEEALIDWRRPASELACMVRGMNPWPVAECVYDGHRLRIWHARALDAQHNAVPGTVVGFDADGVRVACGKGVIALTELQLPGRKRLSAREFINANTLSGTRLGGRSE